jgi:hypothetical protein
MRNNKTGAGFVDEIVTALSLQPANMTAPA